jgi:hypothetical protein
MKPPQNKVSGFLAIKLAKARMFGLVGKLPGMNGVTLIHPEQTTEC